MYTLDATTLTIQGLNLKVEIEQDTDSGRPWDECDGYGPVREARSDYGRITKSPGERILHAGDRGCYSWVYDWNGALDMARRDGWGVSECDRPDNWDSMTKRQRTELAVKHDFDFLKAWCDENWVWCGVVVTLMLPDEDGNLQPYNGPLTMRDSLWSIEFWQYESLTSKKNEHLMGIINEIADSLAKTYRDEEAERLACEERDIRTQCGRQFEMFYA
jgi:hypothetical protein